MQPTQGRDLSEMVDLLQSVQDVSTNIFSILDLEDHEKRLTRFLAWLLSPESNHDASRAFLSAFLNCYGIELIPDKEIEVQYLQEFHSPDYENAEIDLVIKNQAQIIGVEIKTTHTENENKFDKQESALQESADEKGIQSIEMLYLPHKSSEIRDVAYTDKIATWDTILSALTEHRGKLDTPHEIALFDDFVTNIEKHVVHQEASFSPESELYLKYHDFLDDFQIDIGADSFKTDRKKIYNHLWKWFIDNYDPLDGQFDRERKFGKNTKYIRLYRDDWHLDESHGGRPEFTLEIQGTKRRLSWFDDYSQSGLYRPIGPHFEMTVALNDNSDSQERRVQYLDYLGEDKWEALESSGFKRVSDLLADLDTDATYNKYHMFSKIIEIDFDEPNRTVEEMKRGLATFNELVDSIDEFTSDWPTGCF